MRLLSKTKTRNAIAFREMSRSNDEGKLFAAERRKLLEPNQLSVKYGGKGDCGTSCVFQGASTQKNGKGIADVSAIVVPYLNFLASAQVVAWLINCAGSK